MSTSSAQQTADSSKQGDNVESSSFLTTEAHSNTPLSPEAQDNIVIPSELENLKSSKEGTQIAPVNNNNGALLAAASMDETTAHQLEAITKKIAKKEIELLRLNTNFRIECTKVSKWKPWRLFLYNLGASGCSEAGITSISATRWNYWRHPKDMSRTTAATGPILLLIGHCITLGGVLTESTLDAINDHKVKKKGLDLKTTHKQVLEIKTQLDNLLAERDVMIERASDLSERDRAIGTAEGSVLKDVRDLALNEYSQFFVRANKFFASRDTNSLMAATAATTGGFQGSLLGIISASKRKPRLTGPGGLGFLISGATIVATPPATRLMATLRGRSARKQIASELTSLNVKSVSQLEADRTKLERLLSQYPSQDETMVNAARRLNAYAKQNTLFVAQNELNAREKALADKEFLERMLFATSIGGTKMSWGINLSNAGFRFQPRTILQPGKAGAKPKLVADPAPAKLFTKRVAIGATTYVPGTSLWIMDTLQNRVRGELRNRKLANQNNLPASLLKERLDQVQQIDEVFNY